MKLGERVPSLGTATLAHKILSVNENVSFRSKCEAAYETTEKLGDDPWIVARGAVQQPSSGTDLVSTEATTINNKGVVHGYYCCGLFGDQGFKRTSTDTITEVNTPDTNGIYGNNDFGDLVGTYWNGPPGHAENFKYVNGVTTTTSDYAPTDINNVRRIVGVGVANNLSGVIVDANGSQTVFNPTGSQWTVPFAINESGHVVSCYIDGSSRWHWFLRYPNATIITLDIAGAGDTCAYGINDSNQIVGYYEDAGGGYHSYVDLSR